MTGRPALDDVSFEVERAEIVGLLGPNGAGKTTLMRILSCFLAPTRGTAVLAGCSIAEDTRAVRRALGYLPEAVPLPPEMRVTEYLGFRGGAEGDHARQAARGRRRRDRRSPGWASGAPRSSGRCRAATGSGSGWRTRCWRARRS